MWQAAKAVEEGRKEARWRSGNGFEQVQLRWHVMLGSRWPIRCLPHLLHHRLQHPTLKSVFYEPVNCEKLITLKPYLHYWSFLAPHPTTPWDGNDLLQHEGLQQRWGGCSKLDLLCVVMGEPCLLFSHPWKWGGDVGSGTMHLNAPILSLRKSGSAYFFALFLWGKENHAVLCFIMVRKKKKPLLPFSHSNFHSSNLWKEASCLCWVSCGRALSAAGADTNPPARVEISDACMTPRTKQTRRRCASENGPRVIYSPAARASPTFSEKGVRNHCYGFCISQKAS